MSVVLENENIKLKFHNAQLEEMNGQLMAEILQLKEKLKLALFQKFGKTSEKLVDQGELPFEETSAPEEPLATESQSQIVPEHSRKKAGRKPLNPAIPRDHIYHELSEGDRTCVCCGDVMDKMGEEVSERLKIIPEQVSVECHHRIKYACQRCDGVENEAEGAVKIAPGEPTILPGSILTPELLAITLTNKFCDHLPYYRQEKRFERIGVDVSRQDMGNWQMALTRQLDPLMELFEREIRCGPVLQMDETPVVVLNQEGKKAGTLSYMWLSKGGWEHPVVRYKFASTRGSEHAKKILEGYTGYLQTDGWEAYETALGKLGDPSIIHVGCWAHARRKFFDVEKSCSSFLTKEALKRIGWIYEAENELRVKNLGPDELQNGRMESVLPLMEGFKTWLLEMVPRIAPASLTAKAMKYALNQWDRLTHVVDHPLIRIDNNTAENSIRPFALGRKNWLFSGNEAGAESSCRIYTLIETAKLNGLNPFDYLYRLIKAIPLIKSSEDWKNLVPWNIQKEPVKV